MPHVLLGKNRTHSSTFKTGPFVVKATGGVTLVGYNRIGETPQRNLWCSDWVDFFREHRLKYQAIEVASNMVLKHNGFQLIYLNKSLFYHGKHPVDLQHFRQHGTAGDGHEFDVISGGSYRRELRQLFVQRHCARPGVANWPMSLESREVFYVFEHQKLPNGTNISAFTD